MWDTPAMVHAQEPTLTNMRIRNVQDTHKIFYAVQKGILRMVTRRLDADERMSLRSGCIYAWEERGPHSEITGLGIERFTEGRRWTPSRVRDEFLFYYERYMPPPDANQSGSPADAKPPRDWEPLVKQTYSVWVETENGRRKWHLTAYFTQGTIDSLRCVDDIPGLRELVVPEGHFKSTRVGKRSKTDESKGESSKSNSVTRTYAPFPSPYANTSSAVESQPVVMFDPYANSQSSYYQAQSQAHLHDQMRPGSAGHSPQDRSSASASPPSQNNRIPYPLQQQYASGPTHTDVKSSRTSLPDESRQPGHTHPAEYRSLPPRAQPAMTPLNDNAHIQRGEQAISSYSGPSGLNNDANAFVDSPMTSYSSSSHWDPSSSSHYSPGIPPHAASHMQHMNHPSGSQISPGYTYSVQPQQHHHHQQSYSSAAMQHTNMGTMAQHYEPQPPPEPITVTMFSPNPLPDMPRALPALQIAYEEPPYILAPPGNGYTHEIPTQPPPTSTPPPNCRPSVDRALAPLTALERPHPYKRAYQDDKALRLLQQQTRTAAAYHPPPNI